MRSVVLFASLMMSGSVFAADGPKDAPASAPKRVTASAATTMHYPTLEKMLRRFSRQAGESRTRG